MEGRRGEERRDRVHILIDDLLQVAKEGGASDTVEAELDSQSQTR